MEDFEVTLKFKALKNHKAPEETNLLFFNQPENQLTRGWVQDGGQMVIIGGKFKPTHFAEYTDEMEAASGRLRPFTVNNETNEHLDEVEAVSHQDAAARYRTRHRLKGYAKLRTSDAEVAFGRRKGQLHLVHHTE
jgi:hypothetical protein